MKSLIYCQFIFLIVFDGFFMSIPFLSKLHYLIDIVTLVLLLGILFDSKRLIKIHGKLYYIPIIAYILICVFTALINHVDFPLFLWASRNTFRFFIFFFACILYLKRDDILKAIKFLWKLQFINLPLVIVEFIYFYSLPYGAIDIPSDHVGGIFGIETGCNGRLNIYLCLILIICLINIYEKSKLRFVHFFSLASCMLCACFSELKAFFLEAIGIFVIVTILYIKKLFREKILFAKTILLFSLCFCVGIALMFELYPYSIKVYVDYGYYERKSSESYQLGRLGAFSKINEIFFGDSITKRFFGLGFGNCEYSNTSLFTSDFYHNYSYYNYRWFAHQMLYLETGLSGFLAFCSIIISIALQSFVMYIKDKNQREFAVFSIAFSAIVLITLMYNCVIRSDFGYICYLFLAVVPILQNEKKDISVSDRAEN